MIFTAEDLMKIAASGGGFSISASNYTVEELMNIAVSASTFTSRIIIREPNLKVEDLMKIAVSGKGAVFFEF